MRTWYIIYERLCSNCKQTSLISKQHVLEGKFSLFLKHSQVVKSYISLHASHHLEKYCLLDISSKLSDQFKFAAKSKSDLTVDMFKLTLVSNSAISEVQRST